MSRKLILDLDTGIDDALAIAYALGSPEAELIGITATYGNVLMERSVRNSLAVLDILGASSVPVHPGLPHSSTTEDFSVQEISAFIHGRNGVGEVDIAPSPRSAEATGAVDFIIEASHRYGDELVYVPTGPLTNLAAALEKDPGLAERLKVVLMGGALSVSGNVSPWAEANISQDPDAADAVLRSGIDATMIGLDVTLQTLLTREQTRRWRELGTPEGAFLADMTDYYINDIPVSETLMNEYRNNNMNLFQQIAKMGKTYSQIKHVVNNEYQDVQKINRIFATHDKKYGGIFKIKKDDGTTDVIFIKGITQTTGAEEMAQYLRGLYIFTLDENNSYKSGMYTAYAKMQSLSTEYFDDAVQDSNIVIENIKDYKSVPYIILNSIDRDLEKTVNKPEITGGYAETKPANFVILPMEYSDFELIKEISSGFDTMKLSSLFRFVETSEK